MELRDSICVLTVVIACSVAVGSEPQPPMGELGLSFRSETFFEAADDFVCPTDDPVSAVRWWGSFADELVPGDHTTGSFQIRFYDSAGALPVGSAVAQYIVDAEETWTDGFCAGIEGLGGGDSCPGSEPLYLYEACLDPPFVPQAETEYWIGILHLLNDESRFWAWHEADLPHPSGNESATWSSFGGWESGMINACPFDFSFTVGPYDLAFELLSECPGQPGECEGDVNGDGLVDPLDSGFILARFGCPVGEGDDACDSADANDDGAVDPLDVGFVLARFGECE